MEKWNELCYILSENLPLNTSEQLFELKVSKVLVPLFKANYYVMFFQINIFFGIEGPLLVLNI